MTYKSKYKREPEYLNRWDIYQLMFDIENPNDYGKMDIILVDDIEKLPAADVAPVVHAHYVGDSDGYADGYPVYDIWTCSHCGYRFDGWDDEPTYNYCPNCGAKMDETVGNVICGSRECPR